MNLDSVPDNAKAGLIAMNSGKPLATIGIEPILERLRAGESALSIAKDVGVHHTALYQYLLRNAPEEWLSLSAARSLVKLESAENALDDAELTPDGVSVSRVRESARLAMWNLERVARKMYGQKDESANGVNIQVVIAPVDGEQTVTIEHDPNV